MANKHVSLRAQRISYFLKSCPDCSREELQQVGGIGKLEKQLTTVSSPHLELVVAMSQVFEKNPQNKSNFELSQPSVSRSNLYTRR